MRYWPVNERIITVQFSGQPRNITVIHAYAPTTNAKDEAIEEVYTTLNGIKKEISRHDVIIVGEGWKEVMGKYGCG